MSYNAKIYGELLSDVLPASIDNDAEYKRIDKIFNELFNKKSLSPEEMRLFALLADLLEDYGRKVTGEISTLEPRELLKSLMSDNNLKQIDLADIFGTQSVVSEVLNGKREITKLQAKALAERFAMKIESFI